MTLNKRKLRKMCGYMWARITKEQEQAILERFGTEPAPYEWSEQDIAVQISNFLACGEFTKSIQSSNRSPIFVSDDDF